MLKEWEDRIGIHYLLKTHVYIIPLETTDNFELDCDLYFIFNLKYTPSKFLILKGERNILSLLTLRESREHKHHIHMCADIWVLKW